MLQNVVHPLEELRQVKNQADQLQAFHGMAIGYDSYCNLLLSAASNYDAKYAPKGRVGHTAAKTSKRNVYAHDFADYEDDEFYDAFNLDSDIVNLQTNVHKQNPKDPTFNRNGMFTNHVLLHLIGTECQQWHSLQPEAQATWDLLLDEAKAIILGLHKDSGEHSVNLHNISAFDFLQASMHDLKLDDIEDTDNTPPDPDDDHGAQVDEVPALHYLLF